MAEGKKGISSMRAMTTFLRVGECSEAICKVLNHAYGHPLQPEERAAKPLAGGVMQHGYQCGMIWGAALAAGAQAYRIYGEGPRAEAGAVRAAQRLVSSFFADNKTINCLEITELDESSTSLEQTIYFFFKGGMIHCLRMAAQYAPEAHRQIEATFDEPEAAVPEPPVSCAALLMRKRGASEQHAVMAAGFAGGIGLCGGACGALGAAIWNIGMHSPKIQKGKINYTDPKATEAIERFLQCTDYKFECSEITGRTFANVVEHAAYLREGGCAKILEVLAE